MTMQDGAMVEELEMLSEANRQLRVRCTDASAHWQGTVFQNTVNSVWHIDYPDGGASVDTEWFTYLSDVAGRWSTRLHTIGIPPVPELQLPAGFDFFMEFKN